MSNYMTLGELHEKLGRWLRENPEHKNRLVVGSAVSDGYNCAPSDDDIPGTVLFGLVGSFINEDNYEDMGTLELKPPRTSKYFM